MHTLSLEWQAVWKILVAGIILGSGLPALFALDIRSMAYGTGGDAEAGTSLAQPHPAGKALAYLCFAIVLILVAVGIMYIIVTGQGKILNFDHIYPVIKNKS